MRWIHDLKRVVTSWWHGQRPELVISEPDIEAALRYLRAMPYRSVLPVSWDRLRVLGYLRRATGAYPEMDRCYPIGPGLFAVIKPFGLDLVTRTGLPYDPKPDGRWQVWVLIRPCETDTTRTVRL